MKLLVNGEEWVPGKFGDVEVASLTDRLVVRTKDGSHTALAVRAGGVTYVSYLGNSYKIERIGRRRSGSVAGSTGELRAPMPGQIVELSCELGDLVQAGDRLMVLEAMKMQQPILSPATGRVSSLSVGQGDQVSDGQLLATIEPEAEE